MYARKSAKLVVVIVLALALVYVLGASSAEVPGKQASATGENVTLQYGEWVYLEKSEESFKTSNLTLEDQGAAVTYSEGDDYEYNASAGSVKALASGQISDGETVVADYEYSYHSEEHNRQVQTLAGFSQVVSYGAWGTAIAVLFYAFRSLASESGGFGGL